MSFKTSQYLNKYHLIFFLGLILKISLIPVAVSPYMREFFIPFIDKGVLNPLQNPWSLSEVSQFPYGLLSYLVFYIPKYLGYFTFGDLALGSSVLSLFLMKLPILFFDFLVLKELGQILPDKKNELLFFYWMNPIVIYINSIYSHIDILSVAWLLFSLNSLILKRPYRSALFFSFACLSKFYVFSVLPLLVVYIWNTEFSKQALRLISKYLGIVLICLLIGLGPLILAQSAGYATVLSPEALRLFHYKFELDQQLYLYFGLMAVLVALFRLVLSTKITQSGLFLGVYFIFSVLVFVSNPLVNWYLWSFPGLIYLYLKYKSFHRYLILLFFACLSLSILNTHLEFGSSSLMKSILFTLVNLSFLLVIVSYWIFGLKNELSLSRRFNPFLIGIAGNSGSGKNHTSEVIGQLFGGQKIQMVEGDNYHKWKRGDEHWKSHTHLQPQANHLKTLSTHTLELKQNKEINFVQYDHDDGLFTLPKVTEPEKVILFQGLHTFYLNEMRRQLDIRIFLKPNEHIQLYWKLRRDVEQRGHTKEKVLETIQKRILDSTKYIDPQIKYADWVIEFFLLQNYSLEEVLSYSAPQLGVRHILDNDYHLDVVRDILNKAIPGSAQISEDENDLSKIRFEVTSEPSLETVLEIVHTLNFQIRQITRSWSQPIWVKGFDGLLQIITLIMLDKKG